MEDEIFQRNMEGILLIMSWVEISRKAGASRATIYRLLDEETVEGSVGYTFIGIFAMILILFSELYFHVEIAANVI